MSPGQIIFDSHVDLKAMRNESVDFLKNAHSLAMEDHYSTFMV